MTGEPDTLPGMPDPRRHAETGALLDLVEEFVGGLGERMTPMLKVKAEALREVAKVMLSKRVTGKTSTYSNDARLFNELVTELGLEDALEGGDAFDAMMREWREQATDGNHS